jgi:hypothetical protein
MPVPGLPPLNGRNLAEFYLSSEASKRSILREYAKPQKEQKARIMMYDPVRKIIPEYFGNIRAAETLSRVRELLSAKHFANNEFEERWRRSNLAALSNLENMLFPGKLTQVRSKRVGMRVGRLDVNSTVDVYALVPVRGAKAREGRRIGLIINPGGISKKDPSDRRRWVSIEAETAWQCAVANSIPLDIIWYADLPRRELHRHTGPRKRLRAEIEATCERIYRDWRDIRLEMTGQGEEFA